MIDTENLRTASLYINNQLRSRGLLRDGQDIDFAEPDRGEALASTMGRIMGVVNDLILRRDRDVEHRESLSTTLRTMRAESLRQANDIQRLREKHAEAQRRADIGEAAENALRTQLKSAEAGIHKLKEEAARTKRLVAETRAACTNEVRKRDRQIDALKKAVAEAGRARGERRNPGITTITVTGELGGGDSRTGSDAANGMAMSLSNEGYDLRQETNAFLAELARSLSEENETLLALVRRTAQRLREMSGWEREQGSTMPQGDGYAVPLAMNCEDVANDIDAILEHLRTILTNPSFVPIEEVVVREDEINRLREGWEKMESRWKEAVHLIDGWRRRMAVSGRPVNMEELQMGLRLSPVRVKDVAETTHAPGLRLSTLQEEEDEQSNVLQSPSPQEPLHLEPAPPDEMEVEEDDGGDSDSIIFRDDVGVEEPNVQILQQSTAMLDSSPLPPRPELSPLKDSYAAGNRGAAPAQSRKRSGEFTTIVEEKTWQVRAAEEAPPPPPHRENVRQSWVKRMKPSHQEEEEPSRPSSRLSLSGSESSLDSILLGKEPEVASPKAPTRTAQEETRVRRQERRDNTPSGRLVRQRPRSPASTKTRKTPREVKEVAPPPPPPPPPLSTSAADMPPPPKLTLAPTAASTQEVEPQQQGSSPRKVTGPSRLPLPRTNNLLPPPQQSPLTMATIAAKLAASEREADAARVRAKLKAARLGRQQQQQQRVGASPETSTAAGSRACSGAEHPRQEPGQEHGLEQRHPLAARDPARRDLSASRDSRDENGLDGGAAVGGAEGEREGDQGRWQLPLPQHDEEGEPPRPSQQRPRKRERPSSKTTSRRRSTLNPWELQSLIEGSAPAAPEA